MDHMPSRCGIRFIFFPLFLLAARSFSLFVSQAQRLIPISSSLSLSLLSPVVYWSVCLCLYLCFCVSVQPDQHSRQKKKLEIKFALHLGENQQNGSDHVACVSPMHYFFLFLLAFDFAIRIFLFLQIYYNPFSYDHLSLFFSLCLNAVFANYFSCTVKK